MLMRMGPCWPSWLAALCSACSAPLPSCPERLSRADPPAPLPALPGVELVAGARDQTHTPTLLVWTSRVRGSGPGDAFCVDVDGAATRLRECPTGASASAALPAILCTTKSRRVFGPSV